MNYQHLLYNGCLSVLLMITIISTTSTKVFQRADITD